MDKSNAELLKRFYKTMFTIVHFEDEGVKLHRQGLIRGYFHPYWGEEAIATGGCAVLTKDDFFSNTKRLHEKSLIQYPIN